MKNTFFSILAVFVVIGLGSFVYITRPVSAPTANVQDSFNLGNNATGTMALVIDQSKSEARFSLNELLRGVPTLVVGTTSQITGSIIIESGNPFKVKMEEIKINARTLKTDSSQRDGAISRLILKSEDAANEFIVFKATEITNIPETIEKNKEFSLNITGDLLIKGVTKPVTFVAKATLNDDNTWSTVAETNVTYADFGISVPNLPFLANVDKVVNLKISLLLR